MTKITTVKMPPKTALVFSGGGSRGAYGAGILDSLESCKLQFDVTVGSSTGALLALLAAAGRPDLARKEYTTVNTRDILTRHPLYLVPFRPGAASMKPLHKRLLRLAPDLLTGMGQTGRKAILCVWNYRSGKSRFVTCDQKSTPEHLANYALASCAVPGLIDPVKIDGEVYGDGGVRESAPIKPAMEEKCSRVIVVVHSKGYEAEGPGPRRLWDSAARAIAGMQSEILAGDLAECQMKNQEALSQMYSPYLYVDLKIAKIRDYHGLTAMKFEPGPMREMYMDGCADGEYLCRNL